VLIRGAYGGYATFSRVSMGRIEDLIAFDTAFSAAHSAG